MKIIGIDAGATWIKAGIVTESGQIQQRVKVASGAAGGRESYLDSIKVAADKLVTVGEDVAYGLALPAVFAKDKQTVKYFCNVDGLDQEVSLPDLLSERLGSERLTGDNDAGCAALAEWRAAGGEERDADLLHITWGTGIGTGWVTRGYIHPGWEGGHMPVEWAAGDGQCNCGSVIDLESRAAVPQMVAKACALWKAGAAPTQLTEQDFTDERETSIRLIELASEGDALAAQVVEQALRALARALHQMAVIAGPDVVTLGGAAFSADWPVKVLQDFVDKEASGYLKRVLRGSMISRGRMGNDAGMVGAAMLAANLDS